MSEPHEISPGDQALLATGHWPASKRKMGLGLMLPVSEGAAFGDTPHFRDMVEMARVAKDVGFEALWFADHFTFGSAEEGWRGAWDCWTMMAGVAAAVDGLQIGSLVACTGYRNPGIIAKMAEAIDDISDGRFILGLGAGWHEPEYDMFGLPFDHRVSRFEDAIRIIHPLLRTGEADVQGRFFQANNAVNRPRGPRPAGPPILVGSNGKRMLRLLAQYADAWNTVWHKDTVRLKEQLARLDEACLEVERDPATLVRTVGGNIAMEGYLGRRPDPIEGDDDAKAETIAEFADLGMRHFICGLDPCTPASIEAFAPVIERLDKAT